MKRFYSAIALCCALLLLEAAAFLPAASAKEDVLVQLLQLPAPPPPNPLVHSSTDRDESFYDLKKPPPDNAPIQDLIDYWSHQNSSYRGSLYYLPKPSPGTTARLLAEMAQRPEIATDLIQVLPNDERSVAVIRRLYEQGAPRDEDDEDEESGADREALRGWLRENSDYFADDLARVARGTQDSNDYVDLANENDVLALTTHAWDKARPIVDGMYLDHSQPVTQVLATWALYKHAIETNSLSDIDRYRGELKAMVEDRSLPDGVRDKANDALTHEVDFPGRDEWSFSLFEDETLVNMPRYTMLTTLIMYSPPDKYVERMCDIIDRTSSPLVRNAAINNLMVAMTRGISPELERTALITLLPWLEDKKWATDKGNNRSSIVSKLAEHEIPESVPGLIKLLDEKQTEENDRMVLSANTMGSSNRTAANLAVRNAIAAVANAANAAANAVMAARNRSGAPYAATVSYPFRSDAVRALAKQRSPIAVPALKRILPQSERYEAMGVINALLTCGGFTTSEQLAALDEMADGLGAQTDDETYTSYGNAANAPAPYARYRYSANTNAMVEVPEDPYVTAADIREILATQLLRQDDITDDLARAIVDRIEALDAREPIKAKALRMIALRWPHRVINSLFLRDVKNDRASIETVVRLLGQRAALRERQSTEIVDLKRGQPFGVGISACLLEDPYDMDSVLTGDNSRSTASLLACARMIRAPLDVKKVINIMNGQDKILSLAAERYLESEDSRYARSAILARHPNEAMILGASTAFFVEGDSTMASEALSDLYRSVGNLSIYYGWGNEGVPDDLRAIERSLQSEVKTDNELLGVYAFDRNYVRIYRDRVMFSWDEDDSRYRERPLDEYEFETLKTYLADNQVDDLAPFLICGGDYCDSRELLMLGKAGGRRVFLAGPSPPFFAGLEKIFDEWKHTASTVKYSLSREMPGLELVLANDDLHAETVWKNGQDLRVAVRDLSHAKRLTAEIKRAVKDARRKAAETGDDGSDAGGDYPYTSLETEFTEKRRYETYSWRQVMDGNASTVAVQPDGFDLIPRRDAFRVQPSEEQWKARAQGIEIRAGSDGLFKLAGGRLTKVKDGSWSSPVITPNGRWVVATQYDEEDGGNVKRIDLATGRQYDVETEEYYNYQPSAYIASVNKILVVRESYDYYDGEDAEDRDIVGRDPEPEEMFLLDAATGQQQPVRGEFRPIAQQSFRPLQPASKNGAYWVAVPNIEKNYTEVGVFDTGVFGFNVVLRIPKMAFNSMAMWVDEGENRVYFVYRGHLLKLPLKKEEPPPKP